MNKAKPYLSIVAHLKPTPSFIALYAFIWLIWHNEFVISLITSDGDLFARLNAAVTAVEYNQYIFVFLLTVLVILLRHGFDYLAHIANDDSVESDPNLLVNSNLAATEKDTDIRRVIATLDETREKLAASQEKEKKYRKEKQELAGKVLRLETEIEELNVDKTLLAKEVAELKAPSTDAQKTG